MLNSIKNFFENHFLPEPSLANGSGEKTDEHALQLALAALMVEVIESDFENTPEEKDALLDIVKQSFEIEENEANELIALANIEHAESTDYFQFTSLINQNYPADKKIQLIENLWRIAFSDNVLHHYEEHVIRRISDLIYVSHSDFISTKNRVINELDKQRNTQN